jgi:lipopolysaccharide/colanic/teichoic acid biosynthesis glycosyltransferase
MPVVSSAGRAAVVSSAGDRNLPLASKTSVEVVERRRLAVSIDLALKRALDFSVALLLLVLLSPLFLVIAVAILVDSRGTVLYRCRRVGRHGRELSMIKFRKMRRDADGARLTVAGDARFTRVGKLLARTKLDELPQLWHVVRGEMSLVGPRPEDPYFVGLHREAYHEILSVRPGITGLTQLAFVDESSILGPNDPHAAYLERLLPQKLALDRLYVERRSTGVDVAVLWWTFLTVVCRRPVAVHRSDGRLSHRRRPAAGDAHGSSTLGRDR